MKQIRRRVRCRICVPYPYGNYWKKKKLKLNTPAGKRESEREPIGGGGGRLWELGIGGVCVYVETRGRDLFGDTSLMIGRWFGGG